MVEWQVSYSVGSDHLDQQHQRIIGMINRLGEAMETGKEKEALMKILSDLAGYTKTHFANEERVMEQAGYPGLAEHREQHALLNRQFSDFYRSFYTGSRPQTKDVMEFLMNWLTVHILEQDRQYSPFIAGS